MKNVLGQLGSIKATVHLQVYLVFTVKSRLDNGMLAPFHLDIVVDGEVGLIVHGEGERVAVHTARQLADIKHLEGAFILSPAPGTGFCIFWQ